MKIGRIILAASTVLAAPAYAAIASGTSGNGELFLAVYDDSRSFTLDLGARQNEFFEVAQKDAGYTRSWSVAGDNWDSFLRQADTKALKWSVLASETTGGIVKGGLRLFTTVKSGSEGLIGNMTNTQLNSGIGSTQLGTFYSAVNLTGTHPPQNNFDIHGNSVNLKSDGDAYFGVGQTHNRPMLNGNAPFSSSNDVGVDSYFFFVTRSGTNNGAKVDVDPFDNAAFKGMFSFGMAAGNGVAALDASRSGGYTLTYSLQPVPEPGTYALMLLGLGALVAAARRRKAG